MREKRTVQQPPAACPAGDRGVYPGRKSEHSFALKRRPWRSSFTGAFLLLQVVLPGCVRDAAFEVGEVRTLAASGAGNPTVAVTEGEGAVVAWIELRENGGDVYLARLAADGSPEGDPVRVNDLDGDASPHEQAPAQVVTGPGGEVYVLWQRKVPAPWLEFGGADLRFARSTDGGRTFMPAITINDNDRSSPARISFHDIAVAPDGEIIVTWIDARERDRSRELAYHSQHSGEGFETAGRSTDPEPGTEIRIARSSDGGLTFSRSEVIDRDSCPCCRTSVAVGGGGVVYASWRKVFAGGFRDVAVARSDTRGTFREAKAIHPDHWEFDACPHAGPSLAVDGAGRLHAAWYNGAEGRQGLWYAWSSDEADSFSEPIPVLTDSWVPPSQARLAVNSSGVFVAWEDLRETRRRVRLGVIRDGRVDAFGDSFDGKAPAVAVGESVGYVAWLDEEAVRVARFSAGAGG